MLKLRLIALTLLAFLVIGCSNSVQTMLEDYNSNFTVTHEYTGGWDSPSPGDEDFVASQMLYPTYYVSDDEALNLFAPTKCNSYSWVMTDPDELYDKAVGPTKLMVVTYNGTSTVSREFVIYIPDNIEGGILQTGKTYKLTLTVNGIYSDSAEIVIYKHYVF